MDDSNLTTMERVERLERGQVDIYNLIEELRATDSEPQTIHNTTRSPDCALTIAEIGQLRRIFYGQEGEN